MKKNERYDWNELSETRYARLDEFLGITSRYDLSGGDKKTAMASVVFWVILLTLISLLGLICREEGLDLKPKIFLSAAILITIVAEVNVFNRLKNKSRNDISADEDVSSAENILRNDGTETVYSDFIRSREFAQDHRIGDKYLFFKDRTIIRISDITRTDTDYAYIGEDEESPVFVITVRDELGERNINEIKLKQPGTETQEYKILSSMIEDRRRSLPGTDRPGLSVDIRKEDSYDV